MVLKYPDGYIFKTKAGKVQLLHRIKTNKHVKGLFKCFCGKQFETLISSVSRGDTNSCGCYSISLHKSGNEKNKKNNANQIKYHNGHKFYNKNGEIVLLERFPKNKDKPATGLFLCHCGQTFISRIRGVSSGNTTSCGCFKHVYVKHKEGNIYETKGGKLVLLKRLESNSIPRGLFQCYCGKQFETYINSVVIGDTHSCGCYHSQQASLMGKQDFNKRGKFRKTNPNNQYNYAKKQYKPGDTFKTKAGEIILLSRTYKQIPVKATFKCFCGKEFETFLCSVTQGDTHSCGCYLSKTISSIGKSNKGKKRVIF